MQNVVEVACSSPPVGMNATKPAAQAVQAADQDPFGLVLQKASARIGNDKQSDNASHCRGSKSNDISNGSDSTANRKVSENKNEREVDKSFKRDNSEKPQKLDKSENFVETEISNEKDVKEDPATMIYGFAPPVGTVVENTVLGTAVDAVTINEAVEQAVQPGNLVQISSTTKVEEETKLSGTKATLDLTTTSSTLVSTEETKFSGTKATSDLTTTPSTLVSTEETAVESESKIAVSELLNKSAKVDEKTTTDLNPVSEGSNEKKSEGGKVNVSSNTNSDGDAVITIARNNKEITPKTEVAADKNVIPADVEPGQQTAPPDNPNGTTAVTASANVQNTTQISEPARLAEAPKNEVTTQVAEQISQMVKSNRTSVRMQLYPEELGHIDLRIVTTKDGIGVTMVADKASTQQALKSEMDLLRQSIEQAGIQLSNLNINQGHNSNKQQSFEHRQNLSNSSYPGMDSDNSNSKSDEPRVHLNSSVVDYRV